MNALAGFYGKPAVTGLASALVTALFVFLGWVRPLKHQVDDLRVMQIESDLHTLRRLAATNFVELRERKQNKLPIYAATLSGRLSDHPGSQEFLWSIREYYWTNAIAIPPDVQAAFEKLPTEKPRVAKIYYHESGSLLDRMSSIMDSVRDY